MTPELLNDAIKALGMSAEGFARAIGVPGRTVRRWQAGDRPMPGLLVTLVQMLLHNKASRDWLVRHAPKR